MSDAVAEKLNRFWTAANVATLSRLLLAPVLLVLARRGHGRAFRAVLVVSLAIDIVDGKLAGRPGQASRWGARLDSWADLATYAAVPLGAYWLRPDLVRDEAATFWVLVGAAAVPGARGFINYGALTSSHTRAAVIAAYLVGGAAIVVFAGGPTWPLRIAAAVLVAAALEAIAITAVLPRPVTMVRSLGAALRLRRERFADADDE